MPELNWIRPSARQERLILVVSDAFLTETASIADVAQPLMTTRPTRPTNTGSIPKRRIAEILRRETLGGALLLIATVLAMVWANSSWSHVYATLRDYALGPHVFHLDLTMSQWAGDGLLAIFFFVAGLELKREFVAGDLRDPRRAAVPVAAAVGGVIVPAVIFTAINLGSGGDTHGWAIPTATDIAFALAVLAIISTHLPPAMRTFLLTLAVVDDLIGIHSRSRCDVWLLGARPTAVATSVAHRRVGPRLAAGRVGASRPAPGPAHPGCRRPVRQEGSDDRAGPARGVAVVKGNGGGIACDVADSAGVGRPGGGVRVCGRDAV